MNSQRKLIDNVRNFSPERTYWVDKPLDVLPKKVTVHFVMGQTGYLDMKDPLSAHWANMIDKRAQANQPIYVEIDIETSVIINVLIPRVFTVEQLNTDDYGNLLVYFHQSSAIHAVLHSDPNFAAMRDSLQTALNDGSERLITSTRDDLEIIDVQTPAGGSSGSPETPPPQEPDPPVTSARVTQIFDDMNSKTCVACNPSSNCISFLYPDDGCWIRAHLMAYDMRDYSPPEDPEKIYIHGCALDPFVPNHPDCHLPFGWGWHIAPTLMVSLPGGDEKRVIDPSLASTPISETEWKNLNNPLSTPTLTPLAWTVYNPRGQNSTATESQANSAMQPYRDELKTRCLEFGPPPYSCTRRCFFIIDRSTFSDDEVEAMLHISTPAVIRSAFYIVLDGFRPEELGFTAATMQHMPTLNPTPMISGMTITPIRLEFEYPSHLNRRQRLTWVYDVSFTNINAFTSELVTVTLQASMATESSTGYLYLIQQPNPYENDGEISWLSTDLRVFQIKEGQSKFGVTMISDAPTFISQVIANLNSGSTGGQTFDNDISVDQQTSRLELSGTVGGTPVYNFAVAKVHYRSRFTAATDVRVFFRLFPVATTSLEYDQSTTYRRYATGGTIIPLLGVKNTEVVAIPCFASPRIDSSVMSMTMQTDMPNVQTIPLNSNGVEVVQYFGCWLDINQTQAQFPIQPSPVDGPYTSGRKSIMDLIRNEHQCLVSEIAFSPAPAQNGSTPSVSDKLAQRNLAIVESANPGLTFSRRIPQTFEIRPSTSRQENDELMIDWGNVPLGTIATFYLPGINSSEVLMLASRKYRHHRLKRIDEYTIKLETGGISYLPIPFTDGSYPGLLTIDLPEGIKNGEVFTVIVRQVSGYQRQQDLRQIKRKEPGDWRHIIGSFQLTIPVHNKTDILPAQQRLLSNLRWIERAIPAGNRWVLVFKKYIAQVADRVDALGGDSRKVAPSASGQWQQAYRICRLSSLISALLIAALFVISGMQIGSLVLLGITIIVALLGAVVYLWRKKCRPKSCQLLRVLLVGSGIGAIILTLLYVLSIYTSHCITSLIVSSGITITTAIVSWVRGCFKR
jgi:hypothetical protein